VKAERRRLLGAAGTALAFVAMPALAAARTALPRMTDGPFYPSPAYRARALDWDADLTTVRGALPDGQPRPRASGQPLDLFGSIVDAGGRPVDKAEIEIWQCDAFGSYRHPRGAGSRVDDGFQGFGSSLGDAGGVFRFRTIRPVPYPGRTPHIHVKVRHPSFGELTSQLFVAGDPGNDRDGLYTRLSPEQRAAVELRLRRAPGGGATAWVAEHVLTVG
jgi:protocatechuate 3,4-dioxygenase beta subunit